MRGRNGGREDKKERKGGREGEREEGRDEGGRDGGREGGKLSILAIPRVCCIFHIAGLKEVVYLSHFIIIVFFSSTRLQLIKCSPSIWMVSWYCQ